MYAAFVALVLLRFSARLAVVAREGDVTVQRANANVVRTSAFIADKMFYAVSVVSFFLFNRFWYQPLITLAMIVASSFAGVFMARIAYHRSWPLMCVVSLLVGLMMATVAIAGQFKA